MPYLSLAIKLVYTYQVGMQVLQTLVTKMNDHLWAIGPGTTDVELGAAKSC